jgi:hypothetical protein
LGSSFARRSGLLLQGTLYIGACSVFGTRLTSVVILAWKTDELTIACLPSTSSGPHQRRPRTTSTDVGFGDNPRVAFGGSVKADLAADGIDEFRGVVADAVLEDEVHLFDVFNVGGGVALQHHDVGHFAGSQRANFV